MAAAGSGGDPVFVDDVFNIHIYTGDTSATSRTLTTGMDFTDKGGLAWFKRRTNAGDPQLYDTVRNNLKYLVTNRSNAEAAQGSPSSLISFNSNGVSIGQNSPVNASGEEICLWQFLQQPGFFDIQTFTGNGTHGHLIDHDLGCIPGMIWIKRTDTGENWMVYHADMHPSTPEQYSMKLDTSASRTTGFMYDGSGHTAPTATQVNLSSAGQVNENGGTFVMYLFAAGTDSDSQIFGEGGDEAIIKCGAFEYNSSGQDVALGFEPQYLFFKNATGTATTYWGIVDSERGVAGHHNDYSLTNYLRTNVNNAESDNGIFTFFGNGFRNTGGFGGGDNIIYMAIARPQKIIEDATKFFLPTIRTNNASSGSDTITGVGFKPDAIINKKRNDGGRPVLYTGQSTYRRYVYFGTDNNQSTGSTSEVTAVTGDGFKVGNSANNLGFNSGSFNALNLCFKRGPGFFETVMYDGNGGNSGSPQTIHHSLHAIPNLIFFKNRETYGEDWIVYNSVSGVDKHTILTSNSSETSSNPGLTNITADTFQVYEGDLNENAKNHTALLFANLAGICKVGTYTGNGTTNSIDCGFSSGARFVLVKRLDGTGNWYAWNSVTGIVDGNDPYFKFDTTDQENNGSDNIDPLSSGFQLNSSSGSHINGSGGTYLFLAIA